MYLCAVTVLKWSVSAYMKVPQHVSMCSDSVEVVSDCVHERATACIYVQ